MICLYYTFYKFRFSQFTIISTYESKYHFTYTSIALNWHAIKLVYL